MMSHKINPYPKNHFQYLNIVNYFSVLVKAQYLAKWPFVTMNQASCCKKQKQTLLMKAMC